MEKDLSEDVHSKEDIDSTWMSERRVGKLKVSQVFPVHIEWHWVSGQVASDTRNNDSGNINLLSR